jgi:hypothetical protein
MAIIIILVIIEIKRERKRDEEERLADLALKKESWRKL